MREKFIIHGGRPLQGEVAVRGSKNAATKMMIASLLTEEPCFIQNMPLVSDVDITQELCERIGSVVLWENGNTLCIETREVKEARIPELSRRNRIPILALGPLLHRRGFAEVPVLGGCPIGHRPINFHVEALEKMGVRIERREHSYYAEADRICGASIELIFPSVGATENIILAAVLADGETNIFNSAVEPEILNLIEMLNAMGAKISCDSAKRHIKISGVSRLAGVKTAVMPDRNEIVSFAVAALATGGEVFMGNIRDDYLVSFLDKLKECGAQFNFERGGIKFWRGNDRFPVNIETLPHPGFMTDWQQPFSVLLTQAKGKSIIHETVYDDRFGYAMDLERMGASIKISDECWGGGRCRFYAKAFRHSASILGPTRLHGLEITMTDLRAGMAHIIAALSAEGESVISGVEHIDRGYERIDERLRALGADINRI